MKNKSIKKVLATALVATTVLSSALTVCAKVDTFTADHSKSSGDEIIVVGDSYHTSIAGVYAADSLRGIVNREDMNAIKESLGLSATERPAISIYDTTVKNIEAEDVLKEAATSLGGEMVACLEIDLGYKDKEGKWHEAKQGDVTLLAGLPKDAEKSRSYSIICVQPGKEVQVVEDKDSSDLTVTFDAYAGYGAYAIVAK